MTDFDRDNVRNACTTAMFMWDGVIVVHQQETCLFGVWAQGVFELGLELANYAIYSEERLKELNPEDYPGVYDYEVSMQFGKWFATEIIERCGKAPSDEECKVKLDELIAEFFEFPTHDEASNTWSG